MKHLDILEDNNFQYPEIELRALLNKTSKLNKEIQDKELERAQNRKSQVGTGDRSERIRTYNFPQGRVTDHRINLTLHKLEEFMEGEIFEEMIESLTIQAQQDQLSNLK